MRYYYLLSSLPELWDPGLESRAAEELTRIQEFIAENLSAADREIFYFFVYRNDNKNLLELLRRQSNPGYSLLELFHLPARFSHQELEEAIAGLRSLPGHMEGFLNEWRAADRPAISQERANRLIELFYEAGTSLPDSYVADCFRFKRDLKNLVSFLNARRFDLELPDILVGEDDFNRRLLSLPGGTREPSSFLTGDLARASEVLANHIDNMDYTGLERAMDDLLLKDMENRLPVDDGFSAPHIYYHFSRISLNARWDLIRDQQAGRERLNELVESILSRGDFDTEGQFTDVNT